LATVVFCERLAMDAAVVLEPEMLIPVIEVRPTHEPVKAVANRYLRFGPGEAGEHQNHSQTGFHRRL